MSFVVVCCNLHHEFHPDKPLCPCMQVAAAVSYMHANDVIHLDLTSQNLLVADGGNAKVSIV